LDYGFEGKNEGFQSYKLRSYLNKILLMKFILKPLGVNSRNGKGRSILPVLGVTALVLWEVALWSTVGSPSPL
jgi:hypothetical protein